MKIQELLNEIKRISSDTYSGGKEYLTPVTHHFGGPPEIERLPDLKKLPGDSGWFYSVSKNGSDINIEIWDKKNTTHYSSGSVIGILSLYKPEHAFPLKNAYQVDTVTVDEDYRDQSIAKSLYGIALNLLDMTILSGQSQTAGGRRIWVSLYKIQGVEVMGYVKLDNYDIEFDYSDKKLESALEALMGKLGAINMGKIDGYTYFAFPVKTDAKSKELMAIADTSLSKLYGSSRYETGLFAHWVG